MLCEQNLARDGDACKDGDSCLEWIHVFKLVNIYKRKKITKRTELQKAVNSLNVSNKETIKTSSEDGFFDETKTTSFS